MVKKLIRLLKSSMRNCQAIKYCSSAPKSQPLLDVEKIVEIKNQTSYERSMDTFHEKVLANNDCLNDSVVPKIRDIMRDDERKMLHIQWSNGLKAKFLYVWLRDNCPEKHTYNLSSICKARIMVFNDLNVDIEPVEVKNLGDKIYVLWPDDKSGYYDSEWLQLRNLDNPAIRSRRSQIHLNDVELWNSSTLKEKLIWISFDKIMEDNLTLHDTLTTLCKLGIIFIDNVPQKLGQLQKLASKIGFEYLTHYGHFFMVKSDPNPTNVAYRSGALGFHTDLPYLHYAPQVQALHCIKQVNTIGGENQFVDCFSVAKQMAIQFPDLYKILCTVPFEYIDDGKDHIRFDLTYSRPVFNFDSNGRMVEVHFSNQQRSWFYDVPIEKLHDVYRAQKTFNSLLCNPENFFEIKLQPGQLIIFRNLRVMHARSAFSLNDESSERLLEGCYFNMDIIKSKIRVLRDQLNLQPNQISV